MCWLVGKLGNMLIVEGDIRREREERLTAYRRERERERERGG